MWAQSNSGYSVVLCAWRDTTRGNDFKMKERRIRLVVCEGGEALAHVAKRSCARRIPGSARGRAGHGRSQGPPHEGERCGFKEAVGACARPVMPLGGPGRCRVPAVPPCTACAACPRRCARPCPRCWPVSPCPAPLAPPGPRCRRGRARAATTPRYVRAEGPNALIAKSSSGSFRVSLKLFLLFFVVFLVEVSSPPPPLPSPWDQ